MVSARQQLHALELLAACAVIRNGHDIAEWKLLVDDKGWLNPIKESERLNWMLALSGPIV
ncbi:MAG TPA: hypothetical protein VEC99_17675 [Clostridia bacterium]|nr:hypothetical protein [Clostridia bacterium]